MDLTMGLTGGLTVASPRQYKRKVHHALLDVRYFEILIVPIFEFGVTDPTII
jgi:hypothetical protein